MSASNTIFVESNNVTYTDDYIDAKYEYQTSIVKKSVNKFTVSMFLIICYLFSYCIIKYENK